MVELVVVKVEVKVVVRRSWSGNRGREGNCNRLE